MPYTANHVVHSCLIPTFAKTGRLRTWLQLSAKGILFGDAGYMESALQPARAAKQAASARHIMYMAVFLPSQL